MEEQRIGRMYLNLIGKKISGVSHWIFGTGLRRSAALPWLIIFILVGLPSLGWYLHRRGQFSTLKREIRGQQEIPVSVPSPGGMEPIILKRSPTPGSAAPELTSVTILPGLGMDVLQLTASLPGIGDRWLLANPTVETMASGAPRPHTGLYNTRGAIEAPWGGLLMGLVSPIGTSMTINWQDHPVEVPTEVVARGINVDGLLSHVPVESQQIDTLADGAVATGVLHATDFSGHWPSKLDLHVAVQLGPADLTLTISARNTGSIPVPFGAGWHPRFAVPPGSRDTIELRLPAGQELQVADKTKGLPSGRIVPVESELEGMQSHPTVPGSIPFEATLVNMKPSLLDSFASAEFRDRSSGYGLRLSSPSANTRALRVIVPADRNSMSLGMQTNYDDPFGREWEQTGGSGIVTLLPGQSFEWKVRLEIFSVLPSHVPHSS